MRVNVVGCGETAKQWNGEGFSIGVNDVFRYHPTNYLLLINTPNKFSKERLDIIINSNPEKVFCHNRAWKEYFPGMEFISVIPFTSGQLRTGKLYHSRTSPFCAMSMAYNLGAKEIVLWGVDFKTHRNFQPGSGDLKAEIAAYEFLIETMERNGTKVYLGCEGSELKLPVYANTIHK